WNSFSRGTPSSDTTRYGRRPGGCRVAPRSAGQGRAGGGPPENDPQRSGNRGGAVSLTPNEPLHRANVTPFNWRASADARAIPTGASPSDAGIQPDSGGSDRAGADDRAAFAPARGVQAR